MDDDNDDADGLLELAVNLEESDLQLELGPPPVSALGVVTDGVAGPHSDPLRNGSVLLQLLCELDLDAEGLVGRLK